MRSIHLSLLVVVALCAAPLSGFAQSKTRQSAEGYYSKGMTAYSLGRFSEAIEQFEKAYAAQPEPVFLFNIAQSHRQNGDAQRAVFFYRRYLDADPKAKNRPDVEKRIADLEAEIEAKKEQAELEAQRKAQAELEAQDKAKAVAAATGPADAPPAAHVVPRSTPAAEIEQRPSLSPRTGRILRVAGIASAGAGAAIVLGGVFSYLHARDLHDQATSGTYDASKHSSSDTYLTLSRVSFGVGAAALVTGAVLYYVGYRARRASGTLAFTPFPTVGGGGAALVGGF